VIKVFEWCKKLVYVSVINGIDLKSFFSRVGNNVVGYYDLWKNEIHVFKVKCRTFMGFIEPLFMSSLIIIKV
jgi:flavoprotein